MTECHALDAGMQVASPPWNPRDKVPGVEWFDKEWDAWEKAEKVRKEEEDNVKGKERMEENKQENGEEKEEKGKEEGEGEGKDEEWQEEETGKQTDTRGHTSDIVTDFVPKDVIVLDSQSEHFYLKPNNIILTDKGEETGGEEEKKHIKEIRQGNKEEREEDKVKRERKHRERRKGLLSHTRRQASSSVTYFAGKNCTALDSPEEHSNLSPSNVEKQEMSNYSTRMVTEGTGEKRKRDTSLTSQRKSQRLATANTRDRIKRCILEENGKGDPKQFRISDSRSNSLSYQQSHSPHSPQKREKRGRA